MQANMLTINLSPFPTLNTTRLRFRKITNEDVNDLFEMRSNPILMAHISRHLAQNKEDAQNIINKVEDGLINNTGITWGLSLTNSSKLIGTFGFWRIEKENHRTEIGYMLHPYYQGKGLMHEAMQAGIKYAFTVLNIHSIEASINPANIASINLAKRNGFVLEGYFKDVYYHNGKYVDTCIYTLLNPLH